MVGNKKDFFDFEFLAPKDTLSLKRVFILWILVTIGGTILALISASGQSALNDLDLMLGGIGRIAFLSGAMIAFIIAGFLLEKHLRINQLVWMFFLGLFFLIPMLFVVGGESFNPDWTFFIYFSLIVSIIFLVYCKLSGKPLILPGRKE